MPRAPTKTPVPVTTGIDTAPAPAAVSLPLTVIVPPGSLATVSRRALLALVSLIVPRSEPTTAPFFFPNWACAFRSRLVNSWRSPALGVSRWEVDARLGRRDRDELDHRRRGGRRTRRGDRENDRRGGKGRGNDMPEHDRTLAVAARVSTDNFDPARQRRRDRQAREVVARGSSRTETSGDDANGDPRVAAAAHELPQTQRGRT